MRLTIAVLVLLLVSLSCTRVPEGQLIRFDASQRINHSFIGHGVQWSAYPHGDSEDAEWGFLMTDDKWQLLYDRLDYVKPRIVRVMISASWRYFKGLDEKGNPIVEYDNPEMRNLYKLLDYCQQKNILVLFGEWGAPSHGLKAEKEKSITKATDPRWIQMMTDVLHHLIIDKEYTCINYFNIVNEPNGYWATTDGNWEEWKEGYELLASALSKRGLDEYVQLAGPDAVVQWDHPTHPKKAVDWFYSTVEDLGPQTGMYDVHIYADQELVSDGNLFKFLSPFASSVIDVSKPIVLGELGMKYTEELREENLRRGNADPCAGLDDSNMFVYDYSYGVDMVDAAVQSMLAGFGGAIAWSLDDAMHTVGDMGDRSALKKWGMWNILGEELCGDPEEMNLRPWSYSWTLLCNLFLPGMTIISSDTLSSNYEDFRTISGVKEDAFSMVFVNRSEKAESRLIRSDLIKDDQSFYRYEYVDGDRKSNEAGFPTPVNKVIGNLDQEGLTVEVSANSIVFISTIEMK